MRLRKSWLWTFLWSREGAWSLLATTAGALALGLLPNIVQALPGVGDSLLSLSLVAAVAVVVVAWATQALRSKSGVGIVIYLGADSQWDRIRLRAMQQDALRRHAACFVVEPESLLRGIQVSDRVAFAYRVMQARLEEETRGEAGVSESVSFYVTARHADAYRLGGLLRAQLHDSVTVLAESVAGPGDEPGPAASQRVGGVRLMGQSEERGQAVFTAVRLDSALKRAPDADDLNRLREVLDDLEQPPRWVPFAVPEGADTPRRIALIVAVAGNPRLVDDALRAAELGESAVYAFPGVGGPEARRCTGALVIRTRQGNIPDIQEHHEAFIRYVVHHWRRAVDEHRPEEVCWLFTDGPVTFVLALGALLGRWTALVPLGRRPAALPGQPAPTQAAPVVPPPGGTL